MSLFPTARILPLLHDHFQAAGTAWHGLEALMALVVDHSVDPDPYWPTMLSLLIQAGAVDYFIGIATSVLPDISHSTFRDVEDRKRDALIGVIWCFEQMLVKDIARIGWGVFDALKRLKANAGEPLAIQWQAGNALQRWDTYV